MTLKQSVSILLPLLFLSACSGKTERISNTVSGVSASFPKKVHSSKPATIATIAALDQARKNLPDGDFRDGSQISDHSNDERIADLPDGLGPADFSQLDFVLANQPNTVHPSLHAAVRKAFVDRGLFKIAENIYQVRGDIAHITFVKGESGWIVLDTGVSREFASGAWTLLKKHVIDDTHNAIVAIIYSHSHGDHFGGVKGLITQQQVTAGEVEIIAPYGFMQELIAELIIAGNAGRRRGAYHFGLAIDIDKDGTGSVPVMTTSGGAMTLIAPTIELPEGQGKITSRIIDGIEIDFMDISSAEAPAATLVYLPQWKLLFNSELVTEKLHNIYTLRGAKTRDALAWSKLINRIIHVWGDELEHMTGPHGPSFSGNEKIVEFLRLQRDNYAFLHNQTMKLANNGMKIQDIGQSVEERVPDGLRSVWHTRGYHGTYSHNARGVINRYLGFYDGNPANLNPLKLKPEALKYVEYMGGADVILQRARKDFDSGEYRFVATVLDKLVTARPDHWPARLLLADSYEQLGYQSEGPQWRNAYLTAAKELRIGKAIKLQNIGNYGDLLLAATTEDMLDSMAIRINTEKVVDKDLTILLSLTDMAETWLLELSNSALSYVQLSEPRDADIRLSTKRMQFVTLMAGRLNIEEFIRLDNVILEGSLSHFISLVEAIEADDPDFPIVPFAPLSE